jgi:hypothetical protein
LRRAELDASPFLSLVDASGLAGPAEADETIGTVSKEGPVAAGTGAGLADESDIRQSTQLRDGSFRVQRGVTNAAGMAIGGVKCVDL